MNDIGSTVAAMFESPPTSGAALEDALGKPMPALPGNPWARWLLLALQRHEHRQAWVGEIVRDRLSGSLDDIARAGAFAHPEGQETGQVPGMPGWHFRFHGVGCCLTREGGEELDVDFVDGGTDWIDPWFFQSYLESVADGPRSELGLPCLDPFEEAWTTDLEALRDLGWIEGEHRVRITDAGRELATILQPPEDYASSRLATAWHAGIVGRLDLALEVFESSQVQGTLADAQDKLLRERADTLEERVRGKNARAALKALAQLGKVRAEGCVARQLAREPVDGVVSAALDLVEEWGAGPHREALLNTMALATGSDAPAPYIRKLLISTITDAKLIRHERKALLKSLKKPGGASDGEAGLLLYLLDQGLGIKRLKKALKSSVPFARSQAASALGIIGSAEALQALRTSENPEAQTILAALRGQPPVNGPEPLGQRMEWEGQERRVYTIRELMDAEVGEMTADFFERLQEQYGPLLRRWFAS